MTPGMNMPPSMDLAFLQMYKQPQTPQVPGHMCPHAHPVYTCDDQHACSIYLYYKKEQHIQTGSAGPEVPQALKVSDGWTPPI